MAGAEGGLLRAEKEGKEEVEEEGGGGRKVAEAEKEGKEEGGGKVGGCGVGMFVEEGRVRFGEGG